MRIEIKKGYVLAFVFAFVFLAAVFGAYAFGNYQKSVADAKKFGHSADEVVILIGGTEYTLQQAYEQGLLGSSSQVGGKISVSQLPLGSIAGGYVFFAPTAPASYTTCGKNWGVAVNSNNVACSCPSGFTDYTPLTGLAGLSGVAGSNIFGSELHFCLTK